MIDKLFAALRPMHETEKPEPRIVDDPEAWAYAALDNKLAELEKAVDQQSGDNNLFKALSYLLAYDEHLHHGWLEELKDKYLGWVQTKCSTLSLGRKWPAFRDYDIVSPNMAGKKGNSRPGPWAVVPVSRCVQGLGFQPRSLAGGAFWSGADFVGLIGLNRDWLERDPLA